MSQHDDPVQDMTESTEGRYAPTLEEILTSTESGQASLTANVADHAAAEALLRERARLLADLDNASHPRKRQEIQKEIRRCGIRLSRLGIPREIRRAR